MTSPTTRLLLCTVLAAPVTAQQATTPAAVTVARALAADHVPLLDDPDQAARDLLAAALAAARHPAAELLVERAEASLGTAAAPRALLAQVDALLAAEAHGLVHRAARTLRAAVLRRLGDVAAALAEDRASDQVSALLVIGPFGDQGDHHGEVVFAPELRFPDQDEPVAGRFGPVRVGLAQRRSLRTVVDLAQPRGALRAGCHYGLHQLQADAPLAGYVEVRSNGSYELLVNGTRVLATDRAALPASQVRYAPLRLRAGVNHVLVKTTDNDDAEVALRYVDGGGHPLRGLTVLDPAAGVRHDTSGAQPAPSPPGFRDGLAALAQAAERAAGSDRSVLLLGALLAAQQRRADGDAFALLTELQAAPPADPLLRAAYARAVLRTAALPAELRRARGRELLAELGERPDHHFVELERARALQEQDHGEDAVRLLQARVARGVAGPETFDALYRLLRGLRFAAEARALLPVWRDACPGDVRPVLTLVRELHSDGDARGAMALARAAPPHPALQRRALDLAVNLGDRDLALAAVAELHALEPDALEAQLLRAQTLARLGQQQAATAAFRALAARDDARASELAQAADALLAAGDDAGAAQCLQQALELAPDQHAVRRTLAHLRGEAVAPELAHFRRDGDELIAAFSATARERGASSSLVLDQMLVRVYQDGSMLEEIHQVRRINDLRGVEQHQDARSAAQADAVLLLRTVGTDGRSYVPNRVANGFSMPRLEPGAFLEERYQRTSASPRPGPWRISDFYFRSTDEPFLLSEYVVILPDGAPGQFRLRNFDGVAETVALGGGLTAHVFRMTDVPRLPTERRPPPIADLVPIVTYGEDSDPDAAARETFRLAVRRARPTPPIQAQASALTEGIGDDLAQARAIHAFVHDRIADGGSSADPTTILLTGRGPQFFLEVALLQAAGVPLRHVACMPVRPELTGEAGSLFLGEVQYQVPAARVEPRGGEAFWLFADTARHYPLGAIPAERYRAPAVLLAADGGELVELPGGASESDETGYAVRGVLALDADGDASLDAEVVLRGGNGYQASARMATVEDNVRGMVARQLGGRILGGWTLASTSLTGLEPPGQELRVIARAERRGALTGAGSRRRLPLPMPPTEFAASLGDVAARQLPLAIHDLQSNRWEIEIDPGPALTVARLPAPVRVRHAMLEFELSWRRQGERIVLVREVVIRPGMVQPARFAEWQALLRRLDRAEQDSAEFVPRGP